MPRQLESTELDAVVQLLADHGFDGMAQAIELLMNEVMKLQRSEALGALPYQRTADRRGHANGFKPKTVNSRLGKLELQVPQMPLIVKLSSLSHRKQGRTQAFRRS